MTHPTARRAVLKGIGAVLCCAMAKPALAGSPDILGTIGFEGGGAIPEGCIEVRLAESAIGDRSPGHSTDTHLRSDGKSRTLAFRLSPPARPTGSSTLRLVAHLERADGWLIARGSANYGPDIAAEIVLKTVIY